MPNPDPSLRVLPAPVAEQDTCRRFLDTLAQEHRLICTKSYRLELPPHLPVIPCLDHEAQLQGNPPPHLSVYLEDPSGEFHEVGFVPGERRVSLDVASTLAETSAEAREQLVVRLRKLFPEYTVVEQPPSLVRGDAWVAKVVRAQVRLRDVLVGDDAASVRYKLEHLRAIADLMEKESRVSSWGIRTMTPLLLGGAGVGSYMFLGLFDKSLTPWQVMNLRYTALTLLGGAFMYIGMKAVYLTSLGTRVWKRATEYRLILDARQRVAATRAAERAKSTAG